MSARTVAQARKRRRGITVLWIASLAIITIALIYWEMTALLYILATLGVTALLVTVAMADLTHEGRVSDTSNSEKLSQQKT